MEHRRAAAAVLAAFFVGMAALLCSLALVPSPGPAKAVTSNVSRIELPPTGVLGGDVVVYAPSSKSARPAECVLTSRSGRPRSTAKVTTPLASAATQMTYRGRPMEVVAVVKQPARSDYLNCPGLKHRTPVVATVASASSVRPGLVAAAVACLIAGVVAPVAVRRGLKVGPRTRRIRV